MHSSSPPSTPEPLRSRLSRITRRTASIASRRSGGSESRYAATVVALLFMADSVRRGWEAGEDGRASSGASAGCAAQPPQPWLQPVARRGEEEPVRDLRG